MYRALDVDGERARTAWLTHGTDVLAIDERFDAVELKRADGLITNCRGLPLVMRFADCAPLLLYDPVAGAIGLGHAGWRGSTQGMASALVERMRATYGCRPGDIHAWIGPAISRQNYPVGEDVVAQAQLRFGADSDALWQDPRGGQAHFDLWRANEVELRRAGVAQIKTLRVCTGERSDLFFSHRAERGKTGRFGVVICL